MVKAIQNQLTIFCNFKILQIFLKEMTPIYPTAINCGKKEVRNYRSIIISKELQFDFLVLNLFLPPVIK